MNKRIIGIIFCLCAVFGNRTFAQRNDSVYEILFSAQYYEERFEEMKKEYTELWDDFKDEIQTLYGLEKENPKIEKLKTESVSVKITGSTNEPDKIEVPIKTTANKLKYALPLHQSCPITSGFGYRTHPVYRKRMFHRGVDIACKKNTHVYAAEAGAVVLAEKQNGYGLIVKIKHNDGSITAYGHLNRLNVRKGQKVSKGEVIGLSGNTGISTGPHLHFELVIAGKYVNPLDFLQASN